MNCWNGTGRLVRDPELRNTQSGKTVSMFCVAVDRQYKKNAQQTADFINVVAWGKLAEIVANNLSKGRRVGIEGRLQSRQYEDRQGQKRTAYEIVASEVDFLDSRNNAASGAAGGGGNAPADSFGGAADDLEIPF